MLEVGLRRQARAHAGGRGKESAKPRWGSPLSLQGKDTQDLAFLPTLETHPPPLSLSPEITALHLGEDSSSGFTALPAACRPAPSSHRTAGARPRASVNGNLRAQRRRCRSSGEQLPRQAGSIPGLQPGASLLRLRAPYLTSVTCRLRHQMSVLR